MQLGPCDAVAVLSLRIDSLMIRNGGEEGGYHTRAEDQRRVSAALWQESAVCRGAASVLDRLDRGLADGGQRAAAERRLLISATSALSG